VTFQHALLNFRIGSKYLFSVFFTPHFSEINEADRLWHMKTQAIVKLET